MKKILRISLLALILLGLTLPIILGAISLLKDSQQRSLEFNGLDSYAESKSSKLLPKTFTLVLWVYEEHYWKTGSFQVGAFSGSYYSSYYYPNSNTATGYAVFLEPDGGATWVIGDGTDEKGLYIRSGVGYIQEKTWTMIAGEYDSASHTTLLYINGSKLISSYPNCFIAYENVTFRIGLSVNPFSAPNSPLELYNIQIYDRLLSLIDLDDLYDREVGGKPLESSLVSRWLGAGQQSINTLTDLSGQGNEAKIFGDVAWKENIPSAISSELLQFLTSISRTGIPIIAIFFVNGIAWFLAAKRSDDSTLFSASLFLAVSCLDLNLFDQNISQILALLNILLASAVVSIKGRTIIKQAGRFSLVLLLVRDAPTRFFGFGTFSLFIAMSYSLVIGAGISILLLDTFYGMMFLLIMTLLYFTIREKT
jgi:hypothetical protein